MDEIILKTDGAHIKKRIHVMGATESYEKDVSYDELNENYDLRLDIENIEAVMDENGDPSFRLRLRADKPVPEAMDAFDGIPPVPDIPRETIDEQRRPFYDRLKDPDMQPFDIRRMIHEAGELTERELKQRLHDNGHPNVKPGKNHGGVGMTLVVLDDVTGEIDRIGRGEDKTIRWVGEK